MKKTLNKLASLALAGAFALTAMVTLPAKAATGTDAGGASTTEETGAPTLDLNGEYYAGVYVQGPKYTFRDTYDNAGTGYGTDFFMKMNYQGKTSASDVAEAPAVPGTMNDVAIKGNGTYTVSITGIEWPQDEFEDQQKLNLLGISTNIPFAEGDPIQITDVKVKIDGSDVSHKGEQVLFADADPTKNLLTFGIQSLWSEKPEIVDIGYYNVPFSDVSITFTISGFAYDNAESAEPAGDTTEAGNSEDASGTTSAPATESSSDKSDDDKSFPVVPVVIVVVVVIVVIVAVVLGKKKK